MQAARSVRAKDLDFFRTEGCAASTASSDAPAAVQPGGWPLPADITELEPETTLHHATGTWPLVHAERAALAADLADLTGAPAPAM
jgi:hypothetical protein